MARYVRISATRSFRKALEAPDTLECPDGPSDSQTDPHSTLQVTHVQSKTVAFESMVVLENTSFTGFAEKLDSIDIIECSDAWR